MTKSEFIQRYSSNSGKPIAHLLSRMVALPCQCGEDNCPGWGMVIRDEMNIKTHMDLYAPEEAKIKWDWGFIIDDF